MTAIRSFCKTLCIGAGTFLIAGAACAQGTPWFAAANSASKQVFIGDLDPVTGIRGNVGFYLDAGNILDQNFRGFTFAPDGTPWFAAVNSASNQIFIGDLDTVTGIRGNVGFYLDAGNILDQNFRGFTFAPDAAVVTPGVPEPASWAMLIAGFGLIGGAMRRQVKRRAA